MRQLTVLLLLFSFQCLGQSQSEINLKVKNDFLIADKELNYIYQRILQEYSKDVNFINNLKISQRLWIQYRDAELKAIFPEKNTSNYGSMFLTCWYSFLKDLTLERSTRLKIWINGIDEGEICNGSIKVKY